MKKLFFILAAAVSIIFVSCKSTDVQDTVKYEDSAKSAASETKKQQSSTQAQAKKSQSTDISEKIIFDAPDDWTVKKISMKVSSSNIMYMMVSPQGDNILISKEDIPPEFAGKNFTEKDIIESCKINFAKLYKNFTVLNESDDVLEYSGEIGGASIIQRARVIVCDSDVYAVIATTSLEKRTPELQKTIIKTMDSVKIQK